MSLKMIKIALPKSNVDKQVFSVIYEYEIDILIKTLVLMKISFEKLSRCRDTIVIFT